MDEEEIRMDDARKKLEKYAEPICKTVDEIPLPPLRHINHKILRKNNTLGKPQNVLNL